jgi:hypothetical protein
MKVKINLSRPEKIILPFAILCYLPFFAAI